MLELEDKTCSRGIKEKRKKEAFLLMKKKRKQKKLQTKRRAPSDDAAMFNANCRGEQTEIKIITVRRFLSKTFCKCMTYISRLLEQ